jgi:nicotinamide-nucleotide amidase
MTDEPDLHLLATQAGAALLRARWRLVLAESCTGGWVAKSITDIAGSSAWFDRGFVTYSNASKEQQLGVSPALLSQHGAVSCEVVEAMASGALRASRAELAIAISGIAGPDGGTPEKPVGLVWFGVAVRDRTPRAHSQHFPGDRDAVRRAAVGRALGLILEYTA